MPNTSTYEAILESLIAASHYQGELDELRAQVVDVCDEAGQTSRLAGVPVIADAAEIFPRKDIDSESFEAEAVDDELEYLDEDDDAEMELAMSGAGKGRRPGAVRMYNKGGTEVMIAVRDCMGARCIPPSLRSLALVAELMMTDFELNPLHLYEARLLFLYVS